LLWKPGSSEPPSAMPTRAAVLARGRRRDAQSGQAVHRRRGGDDRRLTGGCQAAAGSTALASSNRSSPSWASTSTVLPSAKSPSIVGYPGGTAPRRPFADCRGLSLRRCVALCTKSGDSTCHKGRVKVRDVIALLKEDGWYLDRIRGSHRQFRHLERPGAVTVAGKLNADLHPKTLGSILNQAQVEKP